jgi:double-stranded uracil-DNA glycosylase
VRLAPRLCRRPRILFVGINPSLHSARAGHHFAGPGNPFWRLLHAAGLVPTPMTFADDVRLPRLGLALTNIAERATREASELTPRDYARGRARLARTIARIHPRVVAFVGRTAYREFVGPSATPGAGAKPERIAGAGVFVVPNPSGRNAAFPGFDDKLVWFRRLKAWAERAPATSGGPAAPRPGRPARPGTGRHGRRRRRGGRTTASAPASAARPAGH